MSTRPSAIAISLIHSPRIDRGNERFDVSVISRVKGNFHNNVRIMMLNRAAIIPVDHWTSCIREYRGNERFELL